MIRTPREVVIVSAVRTPFGRRGGALSGSHALDLLGLVQRAVLDAQNVDPTIVGQVVGGCVGQVGMQSMNVARTAWLSAGLPERVPASTIDSQCGSSQQASTLTFGLIAGGVIDVGLACGVEVMSRVPMGATTPKDPDVGKPINRAYWQHHEFTTQFEGAERIADKWAISREMCDAFGKTSQDRAAKAWNEGRFDTQIVEVPLGEGVNLTRDEGLRPTSLEGLASLKPAGRPDGVHTAGTSSQIADGASAVLMMTRERADALGMRSMASVVDVTFVGCDPVLMLEGPIPATRKLLADNKLTVDDVDVFEINEAFASVVLAWERELWPDMERVNPNGGAIAHGHPLGGTGTALITKAVHELQRTDREHALVTMCCGGGLGTGTLLRRT
ncbi:MAG: acetyl-CoA C-acyltransferase [Acidimicrobiia bacterium]